jgi:streptomycin 6-kinase
MVEHAASLATAFAADPATDGTLVHGDLHYENVLAADREPWLVIDPKPLSGDPHHEPAPLLWNRWDEVVASGDVRRTVRRRLDTVVDAAGLDPDRARDWVVVRIVVNAMWCVEAVAARGGRLDDGARAWIGRCVAIAKAVVD